MELITKYNVGDFIYFIYNSNEYNFDRGIIQEIMFTGTDIYYTVCRVNSLNQAIGSNYKRLEADVFETVEDAKIAKILKILKTYNVSLDDVLKLVPNINLWKERLSKEAK